MKIVEILQGSDEWLAWRNTRVCATDAAPILDKSYFVSRKLLWERKMGLAPTEPVTPKMQRGKDLEEPARQLLIKQIGINFQPCCVEHNEHSYLACSLDGLSDCKRFICEIKAMDEDGHLFAINGGYKDIYRWQMQHQFLVTGCDKCYFASYRPEHAEQPLAIIEVLPDYEDMAELFEAEKIFYEVNMKQFICPEDYKIKIKENNKNET